MSLLNKKITEAIQEKIYEITAILGVSPCRVVDWLDTHVQVNWKSKNGTSVMWRSDGRDWVEVYDGRSEPYTILISEINNCWLLE